MNEKVILPGFKPRFEHVFQVVSTFDFVCWKLTKNHTFCGSMKTGPSWASDQPSGWNFQLFFAYTLHGQPARIKNPYWILILMVVIWSSYDQPVGSYDRKSVFDHRNHQMVDRYQVVSNRNFLWEKIEKKFTFWVSLKIGSDREGCQPAGSKLDQVCVNVLHACMAQI